MPIRRNLLTLGIAASLLLACGSSQNRHDSTTPVTDDGSSKIPRVDLNTQLTRLDPHLRAFTTDDYLIFASDTNHDEQPDNFEIFAVLDETNERITELAKLSPTKPLNRRIRRKEIDVNFDGNIDVVRHYNRQQQMTREIADLDFDGNIDSISHFKESKIDHREVDSDQNGVFEETRYYREGELFRIEKDTNGDSKPDRWEFFLHGILARVGIDHNADGIIDDWNIAKSREDNMPGVMTSEEAETSDLKEHNKNANSTSESP